RHHVTDGVHDGAGLVIVRRYGFVDDVNRSRERCANLTKDFPHHRHFCNAGALAVSAEEEVLAATADATSDVLNPAQLTYSPLRPLIPALRFSAFCRPAAALLPAPNVAAEVHADDPRPRG